MSKRTVAICALLSVLLLSAFGAVVEAANYRVNIATATTGGAPSR